MSSSLTLEQLQACLENSKLLDKTIKENVVIADFNSSQSQLAGAAKIQWNKRKENAETLMSNWDNNTGDYTNFQTKKNEYLNEELLFRNCVEWMAVKSKLFCSNDYGSGWARVEGSEAQFDCRWGQGKSKCKRTTDKANTEFKTWKENQSTKRPIFTETEPKDKEGDYFHKTPISLPEINIQCCTNYTNVNAGGQSNVELSNIQQSCEQTIEKTITELQNTTKPTSATTTTPSITSSTTPHSITSSTTSPSTTSTTTPVTTPVPFLKQKLLGFDYIYWISGFSSIASFIIVLSLFLVFSMRKK